MSLSESVSERPFADLTDVTLADEDTNSILTDNANMAIQGNVAVQVMQPGDQCKLCHLVIMPIGQSKAMWQCKLHNLVANFGTNARDVT
jgi:hypothetical protein